jgi:T-complex protein 1 subunit theta
VPILFRRPLLPKRAHSSLALSISELPSPLTKPALVRAVIPAIASKQYGSEDVLAGLVAEAALSVMPENPKTFNVDNVRVVKIMGGSLAGSRVVQGMVFGREPEGTGSRFTLCCASTDVSSGQAT